MQQDYSGQNLRGRSFKGQNLTDANFSYADIRSTDFTDTNLIGANFKNVKAGLGKRWETILILISWLLAGISGFLSAFASILASLIFSVDLREQIMGWFTLIVIIVFFVAIIYKGINVAIAIAAGSITFAGAIAMSIVGPIFFSFTSKLVVGTAGINLGPPSYAGIFAIPGAIVGAFAFTCVETFVGAEVIAIFFVLAGGFLAAAVFANVETVASIIFCLPSIYIADKALKGDKKYDIIRNTAIVFTAFGGRAISF